MPFSERKSSLSATNLPSEWNQLYLKGWDTWKTDIRLDYYLSESTALAPKSTVIDLPRPDETTFLVEERRIAGEDHFVNLAALKDGASPLFSNDAYFVYRLTSSK